jgi:hypothetical protein
MSKGERDMGISLCEEQGLIWEKKPKTDRFPERFNVQRLLVELGGSLDVANIETGLKNVR